MTTTIARRLAALEGLAGTVVAFGVSDSAFAAIEATSRAAGQRAVRWPLAPPLIETRPAEPESPSPTITEPQ